MSGPSLLLTVALIPCLISVSLKALTDEVELFSKLLSFTALSGMRFTCIGIPLSLLLKPFASCVACSVESFSFEISVYSNDILLPVLKKYSLQAERSASTLHLFVMGMSSFLFSLSIQ